MPPIATDAQQALRDWLEQVQNEMVPEPIIVAKTTITSADADSASIRIELDGEFDKAALELCVKTVVQAFALTKTKKMATIDNVSCKILERPEGKTLWGEALVLDRHDKRARFAVDITDQRDCRVGVAVVTLLVEDGRLT